MGFFDFLKRDKDEGKKVGYKQLGDWLGEERMVRSQKILSKSLGLVAEADSALTAIDSNIDVIAVKDFPSTLPGRFKKIIVNSRPKYLKDMKSLVADLRPHEIKTFEELSGYSKKLGAGLDALAKANIGDGRYLGAAFGDEMGEIQKQAKKLKDYSEGLDGLVVGDEVLLRISGAGEKMARLEGLSSGRRAVEAELSSLEDDVKKLESRKRGLSAELSKISAKPEMKALVDAGRRLDELDSEVKALEARIYGIIHPVSKPLKKYGKICFDDRTSKSIQEFLDDPTRFFLRDNEGETEALFTKLLEAVSSGKLSLKGPEKTEAKIRGALKQIQEGGLRQEHERLAAERGGLAGKISSSGLHDKQRALEEEEKRIRERLARAGEETVKARERLEGVKSEGDSVRASLRDYMKNEFNVELILEENP